MQISTLFVLYRKAPVLWSVHEVGSVPAGLRPLGLLEGEAHARKAHEQEVECVEEEDEEEDPEAAVVAFASRLKHERRLVEVGDSLGNTEQLDLGRKQGHDQATAHAWRENRK